MLNQDEILTLDDNKKYSIVYSTKYNEKNYVYLIDQDDYSNSMFCEYVNDNKLEKLIDPNIIEILLKLFVQSQTK